MFELESENLTSLGRMGDTTTTNWRRFYKTVAAARKAAEKDFGGRIVWSRDGRRWCSGDLGHVMYTISPVTISK